MLEFEDEKIKVSEYIIDELNNDNITFSNSFIQTNSERIQTKNVRGRKLNINYFLNHENSEIQQLSISLVSKKHEISKKVEDIHQIFTGDGQNLELTVEKALY